MNEAKTDRVRWARGGDGEATMAIRHGSTDRAPAGRTEQPVVRQARPAHDGRYRLPGEELWLGGTMEVALAISAVWEHEHAIERAARQAALPAGSGARAADGQTSGPWTAAARWPRAALSRVRALLAGTEYREVGAPRAFHQSGVDHGTPASACHRATRIR